MAQNNSRYSKKKQSSNSSKRYDKGGNEALKHFESQFNHSTSIMFPEASMAMQAMGNPISSPGQSNFIEAWNTVFAQGGASMQVAIDTSFAKRASNAIRFDVCPYFGATASLTDWGTTTDPIQQAAVNLKQFIDTSFGTVTAYDSQDLMLYLMGVSAVFPLVAEIKRDLRLAVTYQTRVYPQFVPKGMFALLRITDGEGNYEHGEGAAYTAKYLRSWVDELNQILFGFNILPIPPEISLFQYNDDLFSGIFTDTDDMMTAQLYVFKLSTLWTYEEEAEPYPMLKAWDATGPISVGAKIEKLRIMVNKLTALQTSSTAMIQNLNNAYGSASLVRIPLFQPEDFKPVEFIYDPKMLISIENMAIMPRDGVVVSNVVANPVINRCEGHVYLEPTTEAQYNTACVNLPLQFHCDYDKIEKEDIGRAMRFHPSLRVSKSFEVYDGTTHSTVQAVTCDGYTGFAIIQGGEIIGLADDGSFSRMDMNITHTEWVFTAADFAVAPICMQATRMQNRVQLHVYSARRDVELTYRLEDIRMFWTYLTGILYGSDLNRNFTGSRTKG